MGQVETVRGPIATATSFPRAIFGHPNGNMVTYRTWWFPPYALVASGRRRSNRCWSGILVGSSTAIAPIERLVVTESRSRQA